MASPLIKTKINLSGASDYIQNLRGLEIPSFLFVSYRRSLFHGRDVDDPSLQKDIIDETVKQLTSLSEALMIINSNHCPIGYHGNTLVAEILSGSQDIYFCCHRHQ